MAIPRQSPQHLFLKNGLNGLVKGQRPLGNSEDETQQVYNIAIYMGFTLSTWFTSLQDCMPEA